MPDFSLAALTLRNYAAPLLSAERRGAITFARWSVDYNNAQAVHEAHRQITHMGALDRFCDLAFHGGDKARGLNAFATLILYGDAETKGRTTEHIAQSREDAYTTLADSLSRTGQTALLQTIEAQAGGNEFTEFLSPADRHCLAGWVYVRHAHNQNNPALYAKGAEAFRQAARDELTVGRGGAAGEAYVSAGKAHESVGAIAAATEAYAQAGMVFALQGQSWHAARSFVRAAAGYLRLTLPGQAGHAYMSAAAGFARVGGDYRELARGAYEKSAAAFEQANDPVSAAASHRALGELYRGLAADETRIGASRSAARLALLAAEAFEWAGRPEESESAVWERAGALRATFAHRARRKAAPDEKLCQGIRDAIAARQRAFARAADNALVSGRHELRFEDGESRICALPFHQDEDVEWCLLSRNPQQTILDLVTVDEAASLLGKRWLGLTSVQSEHVIRGERVRELLMGARPRPKERAQAGPRG